MRYCKKRTIKRKIKRKRKTNIKRKRKRKRKKEILCYIMCVSTKDTVFIKEIFSKNTTSSRVGIIGI
jgi:hypothetical protein